MAKKFYITTAIDYANAALHLGHALEKVQTDVLARYHRLLGEDVFFLTGSDENAQKNVEAAKEKGIPVKKLVDKNVILFKKAIKLLNISNDDFIRTTDKKRHWPGVTKLWKECKKAGDVYKKSYKGLYCIGCEAFLTERDLKDGLCPEHLIVPERVSEENYFFRLSKYQKKLENLIEQEKLKIIPEKRKNEVLSFIKSGLEDFSISRLVKRTKGWGIPVPGDKEQIIYVWFDALSNYITALGYGSENETKFAKYWPADIHVIGKGVSRFHAIYWPAILLSAGIELPEKIFIHGYLTVNSQKISKSLGNIIDPIELVKKYGTDPVRYFLLREFSPFTDGDFTYKKFEERYNSDLAKGLGNLVGRVLTMAEKVQYETGSTECESEIKNEIKRVKKECKKTFEEFKFNETLIVIWKLISFCDRYIEKKRPWEEKNKKAITNLLFALSEISQLLKPFLPETSESISNQLGIKPEEKPWKFKIKKGKPLFPRLK